MNGLLGLLLRVVFFVAGVVVALSLLAAVAVIALVWGVRALWARITGRPVTPWVMRVDPRAGWRRFSTAPGEAAETIEPQPAPAERAALRARGEGGKADVVDVQPREPR